MERAARVVGETAVQVSKRHLKFRPVQDLLLQLLQIRQQRQSRLHALGRQRDEAVGGLALEQVDLVVEPVAIRRRRADGLGHTVTVAGQVILASHDDLRPVQEAGQVAGHVDRHRLAVLRLRRVQRHVGEAHRRAALAGSVVDELRHLVRVEHPPRVADLLALGIHDAGVDQLGLESERAEEVVLDDVLVHLLRPLQVLRLGRLELQRGVLGVEPLEPRVREVSALGQQPLLRFGEWHAAGAELPLAVVRQAVDQQPAHLVRDVLLLGTGTVLGTQGAPGHQLLHLLLGKDVALQAGAARRPALNSIARDASELRLLGSSIRAAPGLDHPGDGRVQQGLLLGPLASALGEGGKSVGTLALRVRPLGSLSWGLRTLWHGAKVDCANSKLVRTRSWTCRGFAFAKKTQTTGRLGAWP